MPEKLNEAKKNLCTKFLLKEQEYFLLSKQFKSNKNIKVLCLWSTPPINHCRTFKKVWLTLEEALIEFSENKNFYICNHQGKLILQEVN